MSSDEQARAGDEAELARRMTLHDDRGDLVVGDDGFVVFWPTGNHGAWTAPDLRDIADEIDRRNAPWQDQVNDYFARAGAKQ